MRASYVQGCSRTNGFHSAAREGRRISREAAARISALRDQDYEGYLRLAQSAKDARLRTLLDKTAEIISDLGLKVRTFQAPNCSAPLLHHCRTIMFPDMAPSYFGLHAVRQ